MARAKWHTIKIVDFGDTISVFFDDLEKPLIKSALPPSVPQQGRIAIYNREAVAGVDKESFIDDLEVRVR